MLYRSCGVQHGIMYALCRCVPHATMPTPCIVRGYPPHNMYTPCIVCGHPFTHLIASRPLSASAELPGGFQAGIFLELDSSPVKDSRPEPSATCRHVHEPATAACCTDGKCIKQVTAYFRLPTTVGQELQAATMAFICSYAVASPKQCGSQCPALCKGITWFLFGYQATAPRYVQRQRPCHLWLTTCYPVYFPLSYPVFSTDCPPTLALFFLYLASSLASCCS
jgi:hypothetical protein